MMSRLMNMWQWRRGPSGRLGCAPTAASDGPQASRAVGPDFSYVPPRIMVVGRIRNLSNGSSSSGKSDANSQFYW